VSTILAEEKIINTATAVVLIAVSAVLVWIAIFYAARVDYGSEGREFESSAARQKKNPKA
ncbi:MAG: hypothetical protein IJM94_02505, partial [Clostridia bacterium]|nr:hypothetical protein [Clostridia bacterium]